MGLRSVVSHRRTTAAIRIADDLDVLPREQVEQLQQHNLTATVLAGRRSATVRRRWPRLDDVVTAADLAQLPLLTPAELAAECPPRSDAFLLDPEAPAFVLRSSGTSGATKMVFHSWHFKQQVDALGTRGVRAALPAPPRRIANCMFPGELNGAMFFVQGIAELLPAMAFPLGSRTPVDHTAGMIREHGIDTLVSSPAYGTELVTTASAEHLQSLRYFLYLGEGMGEQRQAAFSAAVPEVTVRSLSYSTNETGPIGYQCVAIGGGTHHVHEDAVLVEIVDEDTGEAVPDGDVGELVVTPLKDTGMALFRYRIGDRGHWHTEPCPCGSSARLLTLVGRTAQSLTVDVWTISSDQLMGVLAEFGVTDPSDCQFQVLWDFPSYRVRLLLSPRTPAGVTADAVAAAATSRYQLHRVLASPRCTGFTVERAEVGDFVPNERGKVPVLYQRF